MTRYRLSTDPDTGKPCMVAAPDGPWMCSGEVDRETAGMKRPVVAPKLDADGFYRCVCGHYVGCDGSNEGIKALQKAYCADCGARIEWDGIQVWKWKHGVKMAAGEACDEQTGTQESGHPSEDTDPQHDARPADRHAG